MQQTKPLKRTRGLCLDRKQNKAILQPSVTNNVMIYLWDEFHCERAIVIKLIINRCSIDFYFF